MSDTINLKSSVMRVCNALYLWVVSKLKRKMTTSEKLLMQHKKVIAIFELIHSAIKLQDSGLFETAGYNGDCFSFTLLDKIFVITASYSATEIIFTTKRVYKSIVPVSQEVSTPYDQVKIEVSGNNFKEIAMKEDQEKFYPDLHMVGEKYLSEFIKNCDQYLD